MTDGDGVDRARRLVRRTDDKVIAGVCSGLAGYFGGDPLLFRLGAVVLALFGLTGVLVYLVGWAVIPPADGSRHPIAARVATPAAAVLLLLGGLVALPSLAAIVNVGLPLFPGDPTGFRIEPLAVAAALVAIGLLLLRDRAEVVSGTVPDAAASPGPTNERTRSLPKPLLRRRRERSGLTPLTLAAALLVGGGAALLANAGVVSLDVGQLAALTLLVVGLGLVVGAWFGRGRLLILVGVVVTPVVLAASLVDFPPSGTIGSPYLRPLLAGELEDMEVLAGQVTLDLSEYPFSGSEEVALRVAAGSMTVVVPHDVRVDASVSVRGGEAFVFGGHESGFDLEVKDSAGPADAGKTLDLRIDAGFGSVGIYRMNEPPPRRDRPGERAREGERRPRDDRKERKRG